MTRLYYVESCQVKHCLSPSPQCSHHHYFYLASAARALFDQHSWSYHLDSRGEIEQCEQATFCALGPHFDTRAEIVAYHRDNYYFSHTYRPLENPYSSLLEREVAWVVEKLGYRVVRNTRNVIHPWELDLYLPEVEVALEFNGDYWHSAPVLERRYHLSPRNYHGNKFHQCADKNITLGFVWEGNWRQNWRTMVEVLCELIQFRRLSPLLRAWDEAVPPGQVFWEQVDRQEVEKHRERLSRRWKKRYQLR